MALENELFKICKLLMLYSGLWTREIPGWSKFTQTFYKVVSWFFQILFVSCLLLFSVEICFVYRSDMDAALNALKSLLYVLVIVAKMVIVQSREIAKLLNTVSNEELRILSSVVDVKIKDIYRHHAIYCHVIVTSIVSCLYLSGYTYIGDAIYRSHQFYKTHINFTETTPKPHPVQVWFPFNKDKYYKTAMAYQFAHIMLALNYNGTAQGLLHSIMIFFKAKLKILQYKIRNIDTSDITANHNIKKFAAEHQEIVRWIDEFNDKFQYIILLEYCVTSIILASTLLDILQGEMIAFNALFLALTVLQLFALSWNANEILIESSSGLSDALYDCTWYNLDLSSKMLIKFMMMKCEKPLTISIGSFGAMTVDAAVSRMKLAYSVISVLTTSTN